MKPIAVLALLCALPVLAAGFDTGSTVQHQLTSEPNAGISEVKAPPTDGVVVSASPTAVQNQQQMSPRPRTLGEALARQQTAQPQSAEENSVTIQPSPPRTWKFVEDGKMKCESSEITFRKGGRMDAVFVRLVGTNVAVLKPLGCDREYWLAVTNLCDLDRSLVLDFPHLLRHGNAVVAVGRSLPTTAPWLPETMVMTNSPGFYEWDNITPEGTGTLTFQSFGPSVRLVIQNCPYDPDQWVTVLETSKTPGVSFPRIQPKTKVVITGFCTVNTTIHSPDGKITSVQKVYECRKQ